MRLISHAQNRVQPTIEMLINAKSANLPLPVFRDVNIQVPSQQQMQQLPQQQLPQQQLPRLSISLSKPLF